MKISEIRSLEAIKRRIKILELIEKTPMSTKMIYTELNENPQCIVEDIKRLAKWACIEEVDGKRYCKLGKRASSFYRRTNLAYEGYEFLKKISEENDVQKALQAYRKNFGMFNLDKLNTSDVYIKVPGNPNATIVMNSNRPVGFYSYQKHKANVNRGVGSSFYLYDGAE